MNHLYKKINRIEKQLAGMQNRKRKAFVPFIMAGDPSLEATELFVECLEAAGADIIEIGVPFSDPAADGPVIRAAAQRALTRRINLAAVFQMISSLRQKTEIPLLLLLYTNSIWQYGSERFFADCRKFGIDGIIVPDLPREEQGDFQRAANANNIIIIQLVSPLSKDRLPMLTASAEGFLYCVAATGVTGERNSYQTDLKEYRRLLKLHTDLPCFLGFGISGTDQAQVLAPDWDGLIVGSALVRRIGEVWEQSQPVEVAVRQVADFSRGMRRAIDAVNDL